MSWWRQLLARNNEEAGLDEEIRFHLSEETRLRTERGEAMGAAADAARRDFGNVALVKEVTREMWNWQWIEAIFQDLLYGARQLRRNPGFSAVVVLTLGLGIGANIAIFSLVNAFLLRPLPVPGADRIVAIAFQQKSGPLLNQISYPDFEEIRSATPQVFSGLLGYGIGMTGLAMEGKSAHMWTNYVTGDYFSTLGLQPAMGRFILPGEAAHAGEDPVLVLGNSYWKDRFASDPNIVGRKVTINGRTATIIGVAPANFHGLYSLIDTHGYLPVSMWAIEANAGDIFHDRAARNLKLMARLRDGVSVEQAQTELNVVARRLSSAYPKIDDGLSFRVIPERMARPEPDLTNKLPAIAALFLTLTGLVLLLACINVTNILLVRASARQREMAVRVALGAGRGRLMRQVLTESVLLSLLGGVLGLLLGMAAANTVSSLNVRGPIPFLIDLHFDWNVFDFALGAALAAGCVAGLIPAVRATREHLAETLQQGGRSISSGRQLFGSALVVVQVAGSLMLLVVAALFVKSLFNARRVELGYEPSHVANITLNGDEAGYSEAQGRELITTLLARVRGMPGVVSASLAFSVPMGYFSASNALEIPGYQPPPAQGFPSTGYNLITPGYFRTMGIPLVYGREFTDADGEKSQRVAIINEAMAERFWPGAPGNAIGRRFQMMDDPQHWYEVIGVSKNSRIREFSGPYPTYAYLPLTQLYSAVQTLQVRTIGDPELLIPALQRTIESIAPGMPLFGSQTMQQALMTFNGLLRYEIGATLAAVLGMLGLILAVVGLYGVVSYAAAQRTHEIGIRMALGAKARQILGMIVRQGLLLVSIGVLAGLMAALGLTRLLGRFLVGVSASDPLLFATTAVLLGGVALAACYIPARRATRVDPISALRVE